MNKLERHKDINILQVVNIIDQILFNMTSGKIDEKNLTKNCQISKFDLKVSKLVLKLISNKPISNQEIKFIKHIPKLIKDSHVTKAEMRRAEKLGLFGPIPAFDKQDFKWISSMLDKINNQ